MEKTEDYKEQKSVTSFEGSARILLVISLILSIFSIILFFWKRELTISSSIDTSVFGQFGDLIGGVVGTLVALASFFLLLETLRRQQRQIFDQEKQITVQSQDQFLYHLLDRQQNRVNNFSIGYSNNLIVGYKVFSTLNDELESSLGHALKRLGKSQLTEHFENLKREYLLELFKIYDHEFEEKDLENAKSNLLEGLKKTEQSMRWNWIVTYKDMEERELPISKLCLKIGQDHFSKMYAKDHKELYSKIYNDLFSQYDYMLDGYMGELEFIFRTIEKSETADLYYSYLNSQITQKEKVIMFYHLISGRFSKDSWGVFKKREFLKSIKSYLLDKSEYFSDRNIDFAFTIIDDFYQGEKK